MFVVWAYVDNPFVTASLSKLVEDFFAAMGTHSINGLGEMRKVLGMRVELSDGDGYTLNQQATIEELSDQHGLTEANGFIVQQARTALKLK